MRYISTLGYLGVSMEHHPSYGHVNKETIAGSRGAQYQWVGLRENLQETGWLFPPNHVCFFLSPNILWFYCRFSCQSSENTWILIATSHHAEGRSPKGLFPLTISPSDVVVTSFYFSYKIRITLWSQFF